MDIPYFLFDIHDYLSVFKEAATNPTLTYGPISTTPNQDNITFLQQQFKQVNHIAIRDPKTLSWLKKVNIYNISLVPDCAFLSYQPNQQVLVRKSIGLCLHSTWASKKDQTIALVKQIADSRHMTLILYFTNLQEDYQILRLLQHHFLGIENISFVLPTTSENFVELNKQLELVISDRLHAILVGLIGGSKILSLASRHKVVGYCEYMGLDNRITLEDDTEQIKQKVIDELNNEYCRERNNNFCANAAVEVKRFYNG